VDDRPGAPAAVAGFAEPERALVAVDHTGAVAVRADPRTGPRLGAAAVTGGARRGTGHPQRHGDTLGGFTEAESRLGLHVGATARPAAGAGAAPGEQATEEVTEPAVTRRRTTGAEDVAEVELLREATRPAGAEPAAGVAAAGEQPAGVVVLLALGRIGEHRVCLADRFETFLGLAVPRIGIGMQITGELAVRLLDLVLRGGGGNAEFFVVVLLDPLTLAHRSLPPSARRGMVSILVRGIFIRCLCSVRRDLRGLVRHAIGDADQRVPQHPLAEPIALPHDRAEHRIVARTLVLHGLVQGRVERVALRAELLEALLAQRVDELVGHRLQRPGFEVAV